jgi:hypothetical protein
MSESKSDYRIHSWSELCSDLVIQCTGELVTECLVHSTIHAWGESGIDVVIEYWIR